MTEDELKEAAVAQAAHHAAIGHPLVMALTQLVSAYQAVTLNAAPLSVLHGAQHNLANCLSNWAPKQPTTHD